ncbi:MAG: glycosyltransferase [Planctomycetota bacterium]|nr:glycosyltransferase [Planctomycetota bacterium]
MRAVILADEFFATRERPLLQRLEIGLADEGVRVVHAVPESVMPTEGESMFRTCVGYPARTLSILRSASAARVARLLEQAAGADEERIDVLHVFGGSAWTLATEIADELGCALVLEVWRSGLVDRARELAPRAWRTALQAPDPAIERVLRASIEGREIRAAPWGVLAEPTLRQVFPEGRAVSAMIVGSGRDASAMAAIIEGLQPVAAAHPDLLVFCDADTARRAGLWGVARRLRLDHHLSLIADLEGRRDLLLQGDLLIQPDAHGESRSVVLEAMASGMIVVAAADPMASVLIDGRTARLVRAQHPAEWSATLLDILRTPERSRMLAASAHEFIRTHRRASDHVRAVLQTYAALVPENANRGGFPRDIT